MNNGNRIGVDLVLLVIMILASLRLDGVIRWLWLVVLSPLIGVNVIKLVIILEP